MASESCSIRFNIEDFEDFRSQMIKDLSFDIMTGEIPDSTTAEDLNAAADDIERLLRINAGAIYALVPLDNPGAACLHIHTVCSLGGEKRIIEVEVSNVGDDDSSFFAVTVMRMSISR